MNDEWSFAGQLVEFPVEKKYGVILADPPWSYRNAGNGAAKNHYETMTIEDIRALPVAQFAHSKTVLLLWGTWPLVPEALSVIESWGFSYISGFPWIKLRDDPAVDLRPTWGTGFWVRGCSEPMLIGKRKKAKPPEESWLGLLSERLRHSRKPEDIYHYAESMSGPYLELFARKKRPGWHSWGNEIESDIEMEIDTGQVSYF